MTAGQASFADLVADWHSRQDVSALLRGRSDLVDTLVEQAAREHLPSTSTAVVAVGGFGRRELFPHSDVDLLVLANGEGELQELEQPLANFLRSLWDEGLRISHSARTPVECGRLQPAHAELIISLLDARQLAGPSAPFRELVANRGEVLKRHGNTIAQRLIALTSHRHQRYQHTVCHMEPNVKETNGGLRDLHLLHWLACLMPGREPMAEISDELQAARRFLETVRAFLHLESGRDTNLLTFELQELCAQRLLPEPAAPEDWMRLYFGHARRVYQGACQALEYAELQTTPFISQIRDWRSRLSTPFVRVRRDRVFLRRPEATLHSSAALMELFTFVGRHGVRLSWDADRRLTSAHLDVKAAFAAQPAQWAETLELLREPYAGLAFEEMAQGGVLPALIPSWNAIDSLVVRDFYHRYTVDEHTLLALRAIDSLVARPTSGSPPQQLPPSRLQRLAAEEDRLPLVRLALLLHDIGKGTRPGDHINGSLAEAAAALDRLRVPLEDQNVVLFLVERHLELSRIMISRDLDDPATARHLTSCVGTQEGLRRLTLLTYADIAAVNPSAMTPWRLEQLWRVYLLGTAQFTRELVSERLHQPALPELADFLEGFPQRYLRTHGLPAIRLHRELAERVPGEGVAVKLERESGSWLLTILARDQPGLLAIVCGVLAAFGMNILKGEASSNASGIALDLVRFADPMRTLELNPEEADRVSRTLGEAVRGQVRVEQLLERRRKGLQLPSSSALMPTIDVQPDASDVATLIEFSGEDRPGLLYDLASAISANGCNIEVVMIDTEAHKASDTFYVTRNGSKLDRDTEDRLHVAMLRAALHSG